MQYPVPNEQTEAAASGTRLHDLAAACLQAGVYSADMYEEGDATIIGTYFDFVQSAVDQLDNPTVLIEQTIVSEKIPDFGGTVDCILFDDDILWIVDLKTGFKHVSAEDNEQLMCYLLLASERYPQYKNFRMSIVQPRINYVDTKTVTLRELQEFRKQIVGLDRAKLNAGSHCEHCFGLGSCGEEKKIVNLLEKYNGR